MVAWTVDDELVLTAVSDFSIRVWSSTTGVQLNSLKVKYNTTQMSLAGIFIHHCVGYNVIC